MKGIIFLSFCLVVLYMTFTSSDAGRTFDNVNVDAMLRDPNMVQRQIKCLGCKGPCDRIGSELKKEIPRVAADNCRSCSPSEKMNFGKIVNHVQRNYPREWSELNVAMRSGRRC